MKEIESTNHPEDWGSVLLGDLIEKNRTIRYGVVQPGSFDPNGRILVRGQDYSFGWASPEKFFRVSSVIEERYRNARLKQGDLLLTIVGEPGITEIVPEWLDGANITQTTARIPIDVTKASPLYVKYFLQGDFGKRLISNYVKGNAQQGLNIRDVRIFKIITPPLEEQKAIAQVLSDFDNLIDGLERLIAKKRSIKEGVMQELLRPKEGWEIMPLGQVAQIKTGKKDNQNKVEDGIYPFFVRSKKVERIDSYSYDGEAILIPGEGNIGEIFHYVNGKFDYHQRVYKISDFDKCVHGKFLYFYLQEFFGQYALGNSVKATVDSLRLPTFKDFMIQFPPLEEQRVIAQALTDFDNLIDGLECLIAKKRRIKEGVMQELLTGKTRLV
jgi:type I restriction enzyme S subunit